LCSTSVLMAMQAYNKSKLKMIVTLCQTINELTDRLVG